MTVRDLPPVFRALHGSDRASPLPSPAGNEEVGKTRFSRDGKRARTSCSRSANSPTREVGPAFVRYQNDVGALRIQDGVADQIDEDDP